jgi:transposase
VIKAWKAAHPSVSGHEGRYEMREIVNTILYQGRTGCQWHYLPHDLPPKSAVLYYYGLWREDGTTETIHELLRCQLRERNGRLESSVHLSMTPRRRENRCGGCPPTPQVHELLSPH